MSVTGIEKLEFGVEDLTHCAKFMRDFGLTGDASGQRFTTLSGARVELNPIDSPDLPPAFEAGNTLRRMTWAVAAQSDLDALRPELMTEEEKQLLNAYHQSVYEKISPYLEAEEKEWLKEYTRPVK